MIIPSTHAYIEIQDVMNVERCRNSLFINDTVIIRMARAPANTFCFLCDRTTNRGSNSAMVSRAVVYTRSLYVFINSFRMFITFVVAEKCHKCQSLSQRRIQARYPANSWGDNVPKTPKDSPKKCSKCPVPDY